MVELNLTKRQSEIFEFIKTQIDKTGYPPTSGTEGRMTLSLIHI